MSTSGVYMNLNRLMFGAAIALFVMACGGSGGSTGPDNNNNNNPPSNNNPPASNTVTVSNNAYSPSNKTLAVGGTVEWTWSSCTAGGNYGDEQCVQHSVTFDDGVGSGLQSSGSYSRTFSQKGSYAYHCTVHGTAMAGTITVQ